jgi:4-amino-4-deoxy-L-arabinose transferase-like glycosyltransferase
MSVAVRIPPRPFQVTASPSRRIHVVLASLAVLRLWLTPLWASLWLDETTTYWAAHKGIVEALERSQVWPGQQVVHVEIAAIAMWLAGKSEAVLRLPYLLAALMTAWLLFKLGTALLDQETGMLAVVVFVSLGEMSRIAPNARPYSVGLLFIVASTLQLVRWLSTGNYRNMFAYVILAAAIPYLHYLFATTYLVHAIYASHSVATRKTFPWSRLLVAGFLVTGLVAPLIIHFERLSSSLSWSASPSMEGFTSAFVPAVLGGGIFGGILLGYVFFPAIRVNRLPWITSDKIVLLLSWLLVPIVCAFLVARFTSFEIFVPRYYIAMLPALALLLALAIRSFLPRQVRLCVSASIVLTAVAAFGGIHLRLAPHHEDWRGAARAVRAFGIYESTPVLVRVGLIETARVTWKIDIDPDHPYLCPLSKYPLPGRIILLPRSPNGPATPYMEEVFALLRSVNDLVLVMRDDGKNYTPWLNGWLTASGFQAVESPAVEGISVIRFRRKTS